ncbi:hypothetical protein [Erythrobacter aureus]|uniref:hypothetical protein n=1 Tax=Erythrobacter aureus TaxID=2182384 RepID=UPI003F4D725F
MSPWNFPLQLTARTLFPELSLSNTYESHKPINSRGIAPSEPEPLLPGRFGGL